MPIPKKAVFLDRDGTIIQDSGYIGTTDKVEMFNNTIETLLRLQKEYELFIVTNQSGIGKGLITEEEAENVNNYIDKILKDSGVNIKEWYTCPHKTEDNCKCKKPQPFFIEKAAKDFGIDPAASWVIGDHPHDVDFAANAGAKGLYVLTGHGGKHLKELPADVEIFHNISEAADRILSKNKTKGNNNYCNIKDGAEYLKNGGLVAFPTETVYGLGADVFCPDAVENIFALKKRPHFDPLISHISSINMLQMLTDTVDERAQKLIKAFWPGPLTLVFPKKESVPDIVTGGNPTVAVRMPSHPTALALIEKANTPIAAPSANSFGKTSPTTSKHVIEQLGTEGYKIIEGGACRVGVESTVLSLVHKTPMLLRPGGLAVEEIEKIIGKIDTANKPQLKNLESPGLLASHYAPSTPLYLIDALPKDNGNPKTGIILFGEQKIKSDGPVEALSTTNDPEEAAANLYAAMRRLDKLGLEKIIAYKLPDKGLGLAVNDRLKKAAYKG
ncbi:MAG: L-threonylcarbamoyladenylate synthase [Spirochaetales bacterium]|nr:L-threonylcarbamoyladenylate synthase [Spirochaetales bacterium]